MRLTKRCEHGLKAAVQLALHENEGYLQAKEIATREDLPGKFIESILSALRESSLLISKVGARGGYKLARPASQITVASIIEALEIDHTNENIAMGDIEQTPGSRAMQIIQQRIDDAIENTFGVLTLDVLSRQERDDSHVRVEIKPYGGYAAAQTDTGSENGMPRLVLHTDEREPAGT